MNVQRTASVASVTSMGGESPSTVGMPTPFYVRYQIKSHETTEDDQNITVNDVNNVHHLQRTASVACVGSMVGKSPTDLTDLAH